MNRSIIVVPNADVPEIGPTRERIIPDVRPGEIYVLQCVMSTRAGHNHELGSELHVLDFTTKTPHGEISASGRNWVCQSIYGISVWATLESCISRGLLVKLDREISEET